MARSSDGSSVGEVGGEVLESDAAAKRGKEA